MVDETGMIEIVPSVMAHSQGLHHSPRPPIRSRRETHDFTARRLEVGASPIQRSTRTFRRQTATPRRSPKTPPDFDAGCEVAFPRRLGETHVADEVTVVNCLHCPQTPPTTPGSNGRVDERVTLTRRQGGRKVLHDHRVGAHHRERNSIVIIPRPKHETFGSKDRNVHHFSLARSVMPLYCFIPTGRSKCVPNAKSEHRGLLMVEVVG